MSAPMRQRREASVPSSKPVVRRICCSNRFTSRAVVASRIVNARNREVMRSVQRGRECRRNNGVVANAVPTRNDTCRSDAIVGMIKTQKKYRQ